MKNINNDDHIDQSGADIFNKIYNNVASRNTSFKVPYKPISTNNINPQIQRNEADIWNNLYKGIKTKNSRQLSKFGSFVSKVQKFILKFKNKRVILISGCVTVGAIAIFFLAQVFLYNGVPYTKNPSLSKLPINSVVKIIVDENTDHAAFGSGLLFTKDGYILTNAHVITTPLGKDVKNIKVCYTTKDNQDIKCDYDAKIINADRSADLAVIRVDGGIKEIKPYPLVVQQNDETWTGEIYPLGSPITVVGFPGLGGGSVTITKGIVSGYKNGEFDYDDGSLHKIPAFMKTDTEINGGNSGGAAFDKDNRYIGIPSLINYDETGKIGSIIYWNKINFYLNKLVLTDKIILSGGQYLKRSFSFGEGNLWNGIKSYKKEDYKSSIMYLEKYLNGNPSDARALDYLCYSYLLNGDTKKLGDCAERLREANPKASATSWLLSSSYNAIEEKDYDKAYSSINNALNLEPDYILLLARKAELEFYLDKNDNLEKTFNKMWEIDQTSNVTLYYGGLLAYQQKDNETAISYLEASFKTKPTSVTADFLASLYDAKYVESQDNTDQGVALYYRTAGLVLDSSNISNNFALTDSLVSVLEDIKENNWGDSLKFVKGFLSILELDKSLVDPINQVSDTDIRNYIISVGIKEEDITQTKIDAIRYLIKMNTAWLYTLIEDKNSCSDQFSSFNSSNLNKVLRDVGFSNEESKSVIGRNILLKCACTGDAYSNIEMNSCFDKEINKLY